MTELNYFNTPKLSEAMKTFFQALQIPFNEITSASLDAKSVLKDDYKADIDAHKLISKIYPFASVSQNAFDNPKDKFDIETKPDKYIGLLLFGIELNARENAQLPSRTQLAEITRAINRNYQTPVTIVFKYDNFITLANSERIDYKQEWRIGEKIGKVSMLKDINIDKPHAAHLRILETLIINKSVNTFESLYKVWNEKLSVSELNKKFYTEISNWYFWALGNVKFPVATADDNSRNQIGLIRLLTRLIFIWFLKEKKLVPNELFKENAISDLIDLEEQNSSTYYKAILQNLFFATLNTQMNSNDTINRMFIEDARKLGFFNDGHLQQGYYRYSKFIKNKDKFLELLANVPFLNGGLFDCLDTKNENENEIIRIDCFTENAKVQPTLSIPNFLFFNKGEKVDLSSFADEKKKSKPVDVKGLINILDSYKFTIEENTPIEEEVALDPELLGKVFENLLASYNPETQSTARKSTGSFYTPREIVNYMVDESLKAHFLQKLKDNGFENIDETLELEISNLISYQSIEYNLSDEVKDIILEAINSLKILDPACGSGAFPMGILHKLVFVLNRIDPQNEKWKNILIEKTPAEIRDETRKSLENKSLDYIRKLGLIESCIYGVDIQPIAIQISKLRFFISLIVEQKVDDTKENRDIKSLPNLETKFVAANTLIGLEKPEANAFDFTSEEVKKTEEELFAIRKELFYSNSFSKKKKLIAKEKATREKLKNALLKDKYATKTAEQIASWDAFNQNATSEWFDTEFMFGIKNGFDIVIGNPPYVQLQKEGGALAKQYEKLNYKTFERTGDIYSLFYEKGIELLKSKAHLCLITSNKWMRAGYGESTRKFFAQNTNPKLLIDFAGQKVFEAATVDVNILLLCKEKNQGKTLSVIIKEDVINNLSVFVRQQGSFSSFINEQSWIILSPLESSIKKKIEVVGTPLKDWDINIYRGILTGFNDAFIIDGKKKDELIAEDPKSAEIIRPILRGKDIKRYSYEFADKWLINAHNGIKEKNISPIDIDSYPAIKKHLDSYWQQISIRQDKGITPYNLRNCAYTEDFSKQKIVWAETIRIYNNEQRNFPRFALIDDFYLDKTCFFMTGQNLQYLLLVLNSKLMEFYIKKNVMTLGSGSLGLQKEYIEKIPLPFNSEYFQNEFTSKLDSMINTNFLIQDNLTIEKEFDSFVYQIFNLNQEEIEFIDLQ